MSRLGIRITTLLLLVLLTGCQALQQAAELGTKVAEQSGAISREQAESLRKTTTAMGEAFKEITPEQEYYIGRSVGATILAGYPAADDAALNLYLNRLGQLLAQYSDLPQTFGGYHFQLLDSEEINAFAAPGGLIFVSRGLLRCCPDEDAAAAVLAHEIAHVQLKHGLQAIKKSRLTTAFTILGTEGAKQLGGKQLAELTAAFEESIKDTAATLINSGYSRAFEYEADRGAVVILTRAGYDPGVLLVMLGEMKKRLKPGGAGFGRTHPDPADRIVEIKPLLPRTPQAAAPESRRQRFAALFAKG